MDGSNGRQYPRLVRDAGGTIVGRRVELAALEARLDQLARGVGGLIVELAGEPGIGKTRLLAELRARASGRAMTVLAGRAAEFEGEIPFGLFADALDETVLGLGERDLKALGPQVAEELAAVLPSLGGRSGARAGGVQTERYRAHRAVRALLEGLAARSPLVLTLDDVHWADPASAELLSYLLSRPPRGPALVAVAFRQGRVGSRLAHALSSAVREGTGERIDLGPLTVAESLELLGGDNRDVEPLYRDCGGNPFFLQQLARTPGLAGVRSLVPLEDLEVPPAVRAALGEELSQLSPLARSVVEAASVAGDPFEPDLVAEVAGVSQADGLAALDELLARDLVRLAEPPGFRFRHPIVRRAVYSSTSGGWRVGAHGRAARALAGRSASVTARAHHVARSARMGDAEAVALLTEAGTRAAPRAPASAAVWFEAALRLMPDDEPGRLELLVVAATAHASAGRLEESRERLLEALDQLPAAATAMRVRLTTLLAALEHLLGRHAGARERLVRTLQGLSDRGTPEAAALMLELAVDAFFASEFDLVLQWAAEAREAASVSGAMAVYAAATALVSHADYTRGRMAEAVRLMEDSGEAFDGLSEEALGSYLDAAYYLGWAEYFMERFDRAIRHLERGVAVSRRTGQGRLLVAMMLVLALAQVARGRLSEALDLAEGGLEASRLTGGPQALSYALRVRCWVALMAGDLETAVRAGQEALEQARLVDQSMHGVAAGWRFAAALLEAGQPTRAREVILRTGGGPDLPLAEPGQRHTSYELLTRAELAVGRVAAARQWVDRVEEAAGGALSLPMTTAAVHRARAALLLAEGSPAEAAELALAAVASAEEAGALIEAGRTRTLAGRALAKSGQRDAALRELGRAEADLAACGAEGFRREAAAELRRLGRRVRKRRAAAVGLSSLTEREQEITGLVAQGWTNRQIATRLFISEKTVETHVSHILGKFGVPTRTALVARIMSERRAQPFS
jgi:DNA-binding NarL/FixJ family response regulator